MTEPSKPIILVVDDTPANLSLMSGILQDYYQVKAATSGEKALKIANSANPPDLILLDIMMPEMDGYQVCRHLKSDAHTREIPVIFLTAMTEVQDEALGLELGAVDYITKPVSPPIALARIKTQITLYHQRKALIESQRKLAAELNEAADYVLGVLPAPIDGAVRTAWKHAPSTSLGGDAFGYHWVDDDHLAIYLLDVCGHGVGSALLSVSAINALRSQSLKAADFTSPSSVLSSLNNAFQMEDHSNKFFTAWYGVYNRQSGELRYASAGHPPAFLFSADDSGKQTMHTLNAANIAIGYLPDMPFEEAGLVIAGKAKLYVYSDGVYELNQRDGSMLTLYEFTGIIERMTDIATSQTEEIYSAMQSLKAEPGPFEDDFSLLEVIFSR
jgi:sigma-B regulation protein RsbU (phosphoserine phosphatase)